MKKTTFITTIAFAFIMLLSTNLNAQTFKGLDKSPMDAASFPSSYKVSNKIIKVIYSRPQLKERKLYSIITIDEIWRTGANEAAEITFFKDMKLGETLVKAGIYSLFTIPGEKEWTIILNSDLNVWGAYSHNEANNVAKIQAPVNIVDESLEAFSIAFDEGKNGIDMHLGWDTVRVSVPFAHAEE